MSLEDGTEKKKEQRYGQITYISFRKGRKNPKPWEKSERIHLLKNALNIN